MITSTAAQDRDTVRATIRTSWGRLTTSLPVYADDHPMGGAIDEDALTAEVRAMAADAGDKWPPRAVAVEGDGADWTWHLIDADTADTIGTVTVHAGAGA